MEDVDLEMEEMPEEGDERQNRTFILLVAVMGGLLLIGILAFCGWAVLVGRGIIGGQAVGPSPTPPVEAVMAPIVTPSLIGETVAPPQASPIPTLPPGPTVAPTGIGIAQVTATVGVAQVTPTVGPRQAQTVASPTPTRAIGAPTAPAQTGMGAFTAILVAAGLLILLAVTRRLRAAH